MKTIVIALALCATPVALTADAPAPARAAVASADFVNDVVGSYLAVQTALVNDDLKPVSAAARTLHQHASTLGADGQALVAAAAKTADAKTLEAARSAFGELSSALIAYADKTKVPVEGKIVAYCPMAQKSWVQSAGTIANPYYGKAMATCGSATRKLDATK